MLSKWPWRRDALWVLSLTATHLAGRVSEAGRQPDGLLTGRLPAGGQAGEGGVVAELAKHNRCPGWNRQLWNDVVEVPLEGVTVQWCPHITTGRQVA